MWGGMPDWEKVSWSGGEKVSWSAGLGEGEVVWRGGNMRGNFLDVDWELAKYTSGKIWLKKTCTYICLLD